MSTSSPSANQSAWFDQYLSLYIYGSVFGTGSAHCQDWLNTQTPTPGIGYQKLAGHIAFAYMYCNKCVTYHLTVDFFKFPRSKSVNMNRTIFLLLCNYLPSIILQWMIVHLHFWVYMKFTSTANCIITSCNLSI